LLGEKSSLYLYYKTKSMIVDIILFVGGFVIGALVFRNNAKAANADIAKVQADASAVSTAASTVVADVKKA